MNMIQHDNNNQSYKPKGWHRRSTSTSFPCQPFFFSSRSEHLFHSHSAWVSLSNVSTPWPNAGSRKADQSGWEFGQYLQQQTRC